MWMMIFFLLVSLPLCPPLSARVPRPPSAAQVQLDEAATAGGTAGRSLSAPRASRCVRPGARSRVVMVPCVTKLLFSCGPRWDVFVFRMYADLALLVNFQVVNVLVCLVVTSSMYDASLGHAIAFVPLRSPLRSGGGGARWTVGACLRCGRRRAWSSASAWCASSRAGYAFADPLWCTCSCRHRCCRSCSVPAAAGAADLVLSSRCILSEGWLPGIGYRYAKLQVLHDVVSSPSPVRLFSCAQLRTLRMFKERAAVTDIQKIARGFLKRTAYRAFMAANRAKLNPSRTVQVPCSHRRVSSSPISFALYARSIYLIFVAEFHDSDHVFCCQDNDISNQNGQRSPTSHPSYFSKCSPGALAAGTGARACRQAAALHVRGGREAAHGGQAFGRSHGAVQAQAARGSQLLARGPQVAVPGLWGCARRAHVCGTSGPRGVSGGAAGTVQPLVRKQPTRHATRDTKENSRGQCWLLQSRMLLPFYSCCWVSLRLTAIFLLVFLPSPPLPFSRFFSLSLFISLSLFR